MKYNTDYFIEQAIIIHGSKYDYSLVVCNGVFSRVKIICPEHGIFEQIANNHINNKQGCRKCSTLRNSSKQTFTNKQFLKEARSIHQDKYDYSQVRYKTMNIPVKIICKTHGSFLQKPRVHIYSAGGCPDCGHETTLRSWQLTTEDFIKKSRTLHQDKYDYSKVVYTNHKDYVHIICPTHGSFVQRAVVHMTMGSGCPKCADYGFNPHDPAIVYYIQDTITGWYKIGITNRELNERFGNIKIKNIRVIKIWSFQLGEDALELEQFLHSELKECRINNINYKDSYGGYTEFYESDILHLDIL